MQVNIQCSPAYAVAYCYLAAGEFMRAESGAMAFMSSGIRVNSEAGPGGVIKGLMRSKLAGESFFMVRYTADIEGAWVAVAPKFPGDVTAVELTEGNGLYVQSGSVLALSADLNDDVRLARAGSLAMHEGAVMQHVHGNGTLVLSTYGGIQRVGLGHGESLVVDTGHLVAFSESMKFKVGPLGGVVTAALSGEGLVAQLEGPGTLFLQTRAEAGLREWLLPDRHKR